MSSSAEPGADYRVEVDMCELTMRIVEAVLDEERPVENPCECIDMMHAEYAQRYMRAAQVALELVLSALQQTGVKIEHIKEGRLN